MQGTFSGQVAVAVAVNQTEAHQERSPLFETLHRDRYRRQERIREIEKETGRRLLVYYANIGDPRSGIGPEDVGFFQDLVLDVEPGADVDLLLQSGGGDIDTAEKLVYMLRRRAKGLRVIVAERAKSAATMIALAADSIMMSHTSELGPIDPQVITMTIDGKELNRPAQSYLDGVEEIKKQVKEDGELSPAYYPLLTQLDPALLDFCNKAIIRSRQFAEKWLSTYMLKGKERKARDLAKRLTDVQKYSSHGMMIDSDEAAELGLIVEPLQPGCQLWERVWRLYLSYEAYARERGKIKIFESNRVSLP